MHLQKRWMVMICIVLSALLLGSVGARAGQTLGMALPTVTGEGLFFQGQLADAGGLAVADGLFDFTWAIYAMQTGGQMLRHGEGLGVAVRHGEFSLSLGQAESLDLALAGVDGWLELAVRGPGDEQFVLLTPRQPLSPAAPQNPSASPACLHDHWGEGWSGSGSGLALNSSNSTALWAYGHNGYPGIAGFSTGGLIVAPLGDYGVYGFGDDSGVYGTGHIGVVGFSTIEGKIGVLGMANDDGILWGCNDEIGVCGISGATGYGVYGTTWASNKGYAGVRGDGGEGYGVVGNSTYSYGVFGTGYDNHGVYGESWGNYGWKSGVFGRAHWPDSNGVTGWHEGSGVGVYAYSVQGVALMAKGPSYNNLIEAWDSDPSNRRFSVAHDGEVYADGSFHSGGADFAELLPAVAGLEPGDVLIIGLDGMLALSTTAYQPTVVGVYSTQPGLVGGYSDDGDMSGKVPLAVVGVVPVKASAENGPIQPGDLLVASSTPGHAMKAGPNPQVGTVIGKALAALEQGLGVILMLVTIQ